MFGIIIKLLEIIIVNEIIRIEQFLYEDNTIKVSFLYI